MLLWWERFLVIFAAAIVTYCVAYARYRKTSAAFWGYISVWCLEISIFLLVITGAKNIAGFDLFIHTLGVPVLAVLLLIADVLLIELTLIGFLKPLRFMLPKRFSSAVKIYDTIKSLQKYHAIPEPERLKTVFVVSILGGFIAFIALLLAGAFA